jgi:hypothetical protein
MNIFALDHSPTISAQYHCDQHLHKMILESAQILSTCIYLKEYVSAFPPNFLYLPTHLKHPSVTWAAKSPDNMRWIGILALSLEQIRCNSYITEHSSTKIIRAVLDYIQETYPISTHLTARPRIFCGPKVIDIRSWTTEQKYQNYYIKKHLQWTLDKGKGMTYIGRPVPEFMQPYISST